MVIKPASPAPTNREAVTPLERQHRTRPRAQEERDPQNLEKVTILGSLIPCAQVETASPVKAIKG